MRLVLPTLALTGALGLVAPLLAQSPPPPEPAKEEQEAAEPAEEAQPPEAEEAPKPAEPPEAPKAAAKSAPPAAPAAEAAPARSDCAQAYAPLAESYKKAYDDLEAWLVTVDEKTAASSAKVHEVQEKIKKNEAEMTKAKLDSDSKKLKDLTKESKELWTSFNAAKKEESATCDGFYKEASARVKQYALDSSTALEKARAK